MSEENKIVINGEEITIDDNIEGVRAEPFNLDEADVQALKDAKAARDEIPLNRKNRRAMEAKRVVKRTAKRLEVYNMIQEESWNQLVQFKHDVGQYVDTAKEDAVSEWLCHNANGEFILNHSTKEVGFRNQDVNDAFETFIASL